MGRGGSGTIFFAGCNLACVFCQNYDISQPTRHHSDWEAAPERIAGDDVEPAGRPGCENINLVSPSHVVPQILAALGAGGGAAGCGCPSSTTPAATTRCTRCGFSTA